MPTRIAPAHMLPSLKGTNSASATFYLSRLSIRTPHNPCLRFAPAVTDKRARLGPGLPATALAGRDFHPQAANSFSQRTPVGSG